MADSAVCPLVKLETARREADLKNETEPIILKAVQKIPPIRESKDVFSSSHSHEASSPYFEIPMGEMNGKNTSRTNPTEKAGKHCCTL